jgi:hypothetical protein
MLNNSRITQRLAFLVMMTSLMLLWASPLHSQNINSPLSILGPGEVRGNEYFRNMGMGGLSQGYRSNLSVNYLNPASYTSLDSLSFIFDGTVFSHLYQQKVAGPDQTTLYTNLGSFSFAFPVSRRWSVAAGLLPWSQTGYKITDFTESEASDRVNFQYEGSGGINQVYFGNAIRLFKGFSLGMNVSYLFGRTEDRMISYSNTTGFHSTAWSDSRQAGGFMFSYGVQHQITTGSTSNLVLGASYTGLTALNLTQNRYTYRTLSAGGAVDTLSRSIENKGTMEIPANLAAGAFMTFNSRWAAGIDVRTQNWSTYKTFDQIHNLNDAYQVRLGAVYTPRLETYSGFLNRIEYRSGVRYGQSYVRLNDAGGTPQDFTELGISFGVALPVRRSLSALNLSFEYSNRATGNADMMSENFFRFNIGVSVYERWFVKRKFY